MDRNLIGSSCSNYQSKNDLMLTYNTSMAIVLEVIIRSIQMYVLWFCQRITDLFISIVEQVPTTITIAWTL